MPIKKTKKKNKIKEDQKQVVVPMSMSHLSQNKKFILEVPEKAMIELLKISGIQSDNIKVGVVELISQVNKKINATSNSVSFRNKENNSTIIYEGVWKIEKDQDLFMPRSYTTHKGWKIYIVGQYLPEELFEFEWEMI